MNLIQVRKLRVWFTLGESRVTAVDDVNLDLAAGERLGLVGESGAGKSSLGRALIGLVPDGQVGGSICYDGEELVGLDEDRWRTMRWAHLACALQQSGTAFSPVHRVGVQLGDPLVSHFGLSAAQARRRIEDLAQRFQLDSALLERYPHQLSGGEKRRAMLVMALAGDPRVLIADEPTSGLDPLTARQVLDDLLQLQHEHGFALLLLSHNLREVASITERTLVMYAGKVVEELASADLLRDGRHPYTWALASAQPGANPRRDVRGIPGAPPDPVQRPSGCHFRTRCTQAESICVEQEPPLQLHADRVLACHFGGLKSVLEVDGVSFTYAHASRPALDYVSFTLRHGEALAIAGETGSGKSTLAQILAGALQPSSGNVRFQGTVVGSADREAQRRVRRALQLVFQDPYDALSPRLSVLELVREPLDIQHVGTRTEREANVADALRLVRLPTDAQFLGAFSHQLSGGQLQRVALARALVLEPLVLVADEPFAMLDGSEQAYMLNLLKELQLARGLALVLISHEVAAACRLADMLLVVRDGRVVEYGPAADMLTEPREAYSRALLAVHHDRRTKTDLLSAIGCPPAMPPGV